MAVLEPGRRVGPYEIQELLGQGGMGVVFKAFDVEKNRPVALKIVLRELATDDRFMKRFHREAIIARAISHPNVVALLDIGAEAGLPFLVFEFIEGRTLKDAIRERGKIPWREAAAIGAQVARALSAVHGAAMVHRDVKPPNVLIDEAGVAKLADFGLARATERTGPGLTALTRSSEMLGTLEYMAPEQTGHSSEVDQRADLYSLGATLYHMLTGEAPFAGDPVELVTKHLTLEPEPVRASTPEVPEALDAIVLRLLSKLPEERGNSATAIAEELEELARRSSRRGSAATAPEEQRPRRLALAAFALVAVAVATGAGALALTRRTDKPRPPAAAETPSAPTQTAAAPPSERPKEPPRKRFEGAPDWFEELSDADRPPFPLPAGLRFGERAGEYVNEKDGSVLVYVPATSFLMGTDDKEAREDEKPAHQVELSAYFLGKLEVTNAQFESFVNAKGGDLTRAESAGRCFAMTRSGLTGEAVDGACWRTPSGDGVPAAKDHPVVAVNWDEARAYCAWAGLRLPTEAEWERAAAWDAKARRARRFAWGDELPGPSSKKVGNLADEILLSAGRLDHYRGFEKSYGGLSAGFDQNIRPGKPIFAGYRDGFPRTAPVGAFPAGASPVGALDMSGNVFEWCEDIHVEGFYRERSEKDPLPPEKGHENAPRVVRGGSWGSRPLTTRTTFRGFTYATLSFEWVGFRVAHSAR